jgi:hypothetical protein
MNRLCTASAVVVLVIFGALAPARAVPPTVTPSPGYDARLQESRKAAEGSSSPAVQPAAPSPRHHGKRKP